MKNNVTLSTVVVVVIAALVVVLLCVLCLKGILELLMGKS